MKKNVFACVLLGLCFLLPSCSTHSPSTKAVSIVDIASAAEEEIEMCPLYNTGLVNTAALMEKGFLCVYHDNGRLGSSVRAIDDMNFKYGTRKDEAPEIPQPERQLHLVRKYRENGNIYATFIILNDGAEGLAKTYYETGMLWCEVPYRNGKPNGQMKMYGESGGLIITIVLNDGVPVSGKHHNSDETTSPLTNAELDDIENELRKHRLEIQ